MTQEERLQKEIERIVSCEEELNYFENKGDLIEFVARHFYEFGKNVDERTRREMIFFLQEEISQCSIKEHADKLKEFVSYLEKQQEQKPVEKEQDSIAFLEQHGYAIVPPHAPVSIVPSSEATLTKWSEEDEAMLDSVIRIITQFDDLAHEPTFAGPKWTHPYTKELNFLEKLRNRLFEENN